MNRQEVYYKVRDHLLAQNQQSIDAGGTCYYRMRSGLKCAIGCLISDEAYHSGLERCTVKEPNVIGALRVSGYDVGPEDREFLRELQRIHDNCDVGEWPGELEELASNWGLSS